VTVSNVVAIYAAVVGTGSLGWQVYRERRRLRTNVRVEFEHSAQPVNMPMVSWGAEPLGPDPLYSELAVVIINNGETVEWVRSVWIEDAAGTAGSDLGNEHRGDLELKPRARVFARIDTADLPFDPEGGFFGIARLASGEEVRSNLSHLDDVILAHITDWNSRAGA
jgi:hypothetical protein